MNSDRAGSGPTDVIYVSWGGTGRASTLRHALNAASGDDRGLLYLAILDDTGFGDLDDAMLELAKDELNWLLDAQLELAVRQTGLDDVAVRVQVRTGDVADVIIDTAGAVGAGTPVLIGAPIPEAAQSSVADLTAMLKSKLSGPVSLIGP